MAIKTFFTKLQHAEKEKDLEETKNSGMQHYSLCISFRIKNGKNKFYKFTENKLNVRIISKADINLKC